MRLTSILCQKGNCYNLVRAGFRFCYQHNCGVEQAEKEAEEAQRSREYGYAHPTVDDYDESLDDPNYEEPYEGDEEE